MSSRDAGLSPLKRAYLAVEQLQAKIEALQAGPGEPIAIIGIGCRFPGGADTPDDLWHLVHRGVDAIGDVPAERWSTADVNAASDGAAVPTRGGFLADVDRFDPALFGISPREAFSLDPQHRLLLEVAWEALERAGQLRNRLAVNQTGVFIGITSHDYAQIHAVSGGSDELDAYHITGNALNAAAGRLSYVFGFQGPCLAIDTACSSSLVAVHYACRSLASGECSLALAGGVNVILTPVASIALTRARILSADGRCKAFDASADGMGRSEGCGVVVLKRLADALADRDHIIAVIAGSAVNQDGPSSGLTVPNGPAQEALIRRALAAARVSTNEVDYVEAHGTGTALGDPVEFGALSAVFAPGRSPERPLYLGSVKSNIGHSEAAAGIAGLIKAALSVRHSEIPPHLHFSRPSPHIRWSGIPITVPTTPTPWPMTESRRTAGVSSFGFTGTNAHVIVQEAPPVLADQSVVLRRPHQLLVLSARSLPALKALATRYADHVDASGRSCSVEDVCFTASVGRSHFEHRLALDAASADNLASRLRASATDLAGDATIGYAETSPRIAWVFPDDCGQPLHVGGATRETEPTFEESLEECDRMLRPRLGWSLFDTLGPDRTRPDDPMRRVLALFALQYAFAQVWRSWGIIPAALIGEGVGEYAAAVVAEALSLGDALESLVARERAHGGRALASDVRFKAPKIRILDPRDGMPGDGYDALMEIGPASPRLDVAEPYLPGITADEAECRQLLSTLGTLYVRGAEIDWRAFWRNRGGRHVVLPTYPFDRQRYWIGQATEHKRSRATPALTGAAHPLLGERMHLAGTSEQRFESRVRADEPAFLQDHRVLGETVLPVAAYLELALAAAGGNESSVAIELRDVTFQRPLVLSPETATAIQTVLTAQGEDARRFAVFSKSGVDGAGSTGQWLEHCSGVLAFSSAEERPSSGPDLQSLQRAITEPVTPADVYERCRNRGIELGPQFRSLIRLTRRDGEALGVVELPDETNAHAERFRLHPVLLDGCLQVLNGAGWDGGADNMYLPLALARVRVSEPLPPRLWSHARIRPVDTADPSQLIVDFRIFADEGRLVATIDELQLQRTRATSLAPTLVRHDWLYEIEWHAQPQSQDLQPADGIDEAEPWLLLADSRGIAERVAQHLAQRGAPCALVTGSTAHDARDGHRYSIDPHSTDDYRRVLDDFARATRAPVRGIVHLWALDSISLADPPALRTAATLQCESALHLLQAIARQRSQRPPKLMLVTQGAPAVGGQQPLAGVFQAPLWGLGKALALEHPELSCVRLDLDPALVDSGRMAREVINELSATGEEGEIAYRREQRLVARLARHSSTKASARPVTLRDDAAYLITGGLSGLGLRVAHWMAGRGARHLALMGRSGPSAISREQIASLHERGVSATYYQGDVSDANHVQRVLEGIAAASLPLRGIIHSAGILADGALLLQTWDRFERVLKPKVDGAWHLHALTLDQPLDFFVLFSSAASMLGSPAQANHCAANAFLDALASYRQAQGQPAFSINWGAWSEIGAAAGSEVSARLAMHGMGAMTPDQGLAILEYVMTGSTPQVGAIPIEWPSVMSRVAKGAEPRFFSIIAGAERARVESGVRASPAPPQSFPARGSVAERSAWLQDYLTERVAAALQLAKVQVSPTRALSVMGLDSLMAIDIRNRLKTELALDVPIVTFLDGSSVATLAGTLAQATNTLSGPDVRAASVESPATSDSRLPRAMPPEISPDLASQLLSRLGELTADQVDALLAAVGAPVSRIESE